MKNLTKIFKGNDPGGVFAAAVLLSTAICVLFNGIKLIWFMPVYKGGFGPLGEHSLIPVFWGNVALVVLPILAMIFIILAMKKKPWLMLIAAVLLIIPEIFLQDRVLALTQCAIMCCLWFWFVRKNGKSDGYRTAFTAVLILLTIMVVRVGAGLALEGFVYGLDFYFLKMLIVEYLVSAWYAPEGFVLLWLFAKSRNPENQYLAKKRILLAILSICWLLVILLEAASLLMPAFFFSS